MSNCFCFALILISTPFANRLAAEVLEGRVVEDGSGSSVASARLRVLRAGSTDLAADLETNTDGRFRSPDLPVGEYRVETSKSGYVATTALLRPPAAALTIRLVRCGVITGEVTDSQGRSIRGASVFAMVKQPGGAFLRPLNSTPVDDRGQYRLYNLSPGQYAVAVSLVDLASGFSSASGMLLHPNNARPQFFTISGGEEYRGINFVLPPGPLYRIS